MSTDAGRHAGAQPVPGPVRAEPAGWVGWLIFGGVTAILLGAFQIIEGLIAVFNHNCYVVGADNLAVHGREMSTLREELSEGRRPLAGGQPAS